MEATRDTRLIYTLSRTPKHKEYMLKGCPVFLQTLNKGREDEFREEATEDVPIIPGLFLILINLIGEDSDPFQEFTSKELEEHLKLILELLKKEELYAKFSKCEFWIPKVQFLDHVIDSHDIHLNLQRSSLSGVDKQNQVIPVKQNYVVHQILAIPEEAKILSYTAMYNQVVGADVDAKRWLVFSSETLRDYYFTEPVYGVHTNVVAEALEAGKRMKHGNHLRTSRDDRCVGGVGYQARRAGNPVSIIYDHDPRFASNFWRSLQKALGTNLDMTTAYHPQIWKGNSKRNIQLSRDIDGGLLPFDFVVHLCAGLRLDKCTYCPEIVQETLRRSQDQAKVVAARDWKKRGSVRFGKRGKLNPRYVGPFKVLEKVGSVAYKLELLEELSRVHNTFHVSNLKKCYADEPLAVPLDGQHFDDKLQFVEEPVEIMDHKVKQLRRIRVLLVKV
ncbi:putative reverse transcriptase domain-containing protein [Tanacetum coccineum]